MIWSKENIQGDCCNQRCILQAEVECREKAESLKVQYNEVKYIKFLSSCQATYSCLDEPNYFFQAVQSKILLILAAGSCSVAPCLYAVCFGSWNEITYPWNVWGSLKGMSERVYLQMFLLLLNVCVCLYIHTWNKLIVYIYVFIIFMLDMYILYAYILYVYVSVRTLEISVMACLKD